MTIYAKSGVTIHIGRVGEHLATDVIFDISNWVEEYGEGTAELVVNQNGESYPQFTTREDNHIIWTVTNSNTADAGMGKCELFYLANRNGERSIVKSAIYDIIVTNSLDYEEGAEPPPGFESWIEDLAEISVEIKEVLPEARILLDETRVLAQETRTIGENVVTLHESVASNKQAVDEALSAAVDAKESAVIAKDEAQEAEENAEILADEVSELAAEVRQLNSQAQGAKSLAVEAREKAEDAQVNAETAQSYAEQALSDTEEARDEVLEVRDEVVSINSNPPYMSMETGNWVVWNKSNQRYEDSGVRYTLSIVKSYPSISAMESDVSNMRNGDLVIIASDVNEEDNSKLYVHNGTKWIFLSDLSGFQGVGIARVEKVSGTGVSGSTDVYTIYLTDNRSYDFTVYNGADGKGAGDMLASQYDKNGTVVAAGGIENYVKNNQSQATLKTWTYEDFM